MKFCVLVFSVIALSACGVLKSLSPNEGKDVSVSGYSKDANAVVNIEELHMVSAYELAATRSTNKMLDESVDIYEKKPQPKIYVKKIEKVTENLPNGLYRAQNAIDEKGNSRRNHGFKNYNQKSGWFLEILQFLLL